MEAAHNTRAAKSGLQVLGDLFWSARFRDRVAADGQIRSSIGFASLEREWITCPLELRRI
jgi:hypothetical protein